MKAFKGTMLLFAGLAMLTPVSVFAAEVLAEVNGETMTLEEFQSLAGEIKSAYPGLTLSDEQKEDLVNSWVKEEILAQEAAKQGLDRSTDAKYRIEESKRQVIARLLLEKDLLSKLTLKSITDQEVADFYDANKKQFKSADPRIHVRHILVKSEDQAKKISSELKKGGDFAKLAQQYSQDPGSKDKGGDLGYFSRGDMVPEFESAAFALKKNQISEPVKTQYGYHIIQLLEKKASETKSLDEVRDAIKAELLKRKRNQALDDYLAKLKASAHVVVNKDKLKDINF